MVKRPTMSDLAKAAGVSIATVDRVINRRLPVNDDTTQRVVQAAEAIGFHATGLLRRRLSEVPSRRFGFLLQKRNDPFYARFGGDLVKATTGATEVEGKPIVEYSEELSPRRIVDGLLALERNCDALAVVAVDHPLVAEAIESISARGKPVFTLLSDVPTLSRKSYLAVDSRKAGRTAAWFISRMARGPGKVGILVGSHRYLSQELTEISFRSYMREHAPQLQLLEPNFILDDPRIAYEAVVDLLHAHRDVVAIYDCGGGREGMVNALRDERAAGRIVTACNELTPATRSALADGTLDLVLDTPTQQIAQRLVSLMIAACEGKRAIPEQVLIPAALYISENL